MNTTTLKTFENREVDVNGEMATLAITIEQIELHPPYARVVGTLRTFTVEKRTTIGPNEGFKDKTSDDVAAIVSTLIDDTAAAVVAALTESVALESGLNKITDANLQTGTVSRPVE